MRSQQNKYTHSRSYSCLLCSIQTERLITSWIYEWILGLSSDRKDFAKKWYEKGKVIINDTFSSPAFALHDYYSCLAWLFTVISTADLTWHTTLPPEIVEMTLVVSPFRFLRVGSRISELRVIVLPGTQIFKVGSWICHSNFTILTITRLVKSSFHSFITFSFILYFLSLFLSFFLSFCLSVFLFVFLCC